MLNRLKDLIAGTGGQAKADEGVKLRLASAALLVEAAQMDGHMDDVERQSILRILRDRFEMSAAEAEAVVAEASATMAQSSQLFPFTKAIKDGFDHAERVEMIEMLWEVAYADGRLHDYESNLVRRIAGLIYVPDQESGIARRRALARLGLHDDPLA